MKIRNLLTSQEADTNCHKSRVRNNKAIAIQKRQPFDNVRNLDDFFSRFLVSIASAVSRSESEVWSIPLDVFQNGDNLIVAESVASKSYDNVLTIRA
jgi:hypothetical protein